MSDVKYNREPAFSVDPECKQVSLFFDQWPLEKPLPCFSYKTETGIFLSPEVYFGVLLSPPLEEEDGFERHRSAILENLEMDSFECLRFDYAYCKSDDSYHLLQYGIPGERASESKNLPSSLKTLMEASIRSVMEEATIDNIADRGFALENESLLFEGEHSIAEGFIGKQGFPFFFPTSPPSGDDEEESDEPEDKATSLCKYLGFTWDRRIKIPLPE